VSFQGMQYVVEKSLLDRIWGREPPPLEFLAVDPRTGRRFWKVVPVKEGDFVEFALGRGIFVNGRRVG
jgi:hypothetical protein